MNSQDEIYYYPQLEIPVEGQKYSGLSYLKDDPISDIINSIKSDSKIDSKMDNSLPANETEFYHDVDGNMYVVMNDDLYVFFIGKKDSLELMKVKKDRYEKNIKKVKKPIKKLDDKHSLKGKIIDDLIENADDIDQLDDDEIEVVKRYTYKPEDRYYEIELSSDDDDDFGEPYFDFFGVCDEAPINMGMSIYDSIVMSGGLLSTSVAFKSKIMNDSNAYDLILYTNGYAKLNMVGSKIKTYKITNEGKLVEIDIKTTNT